MEWDCSNVGTKAGTIGGTILAVLPKISCADYIQTAVLAAVGAVVSFFISFVLKVLFTKRNR